MHLQPTSRAAPHLYWTDHCAQSCIKMHFHHLEYTKRIFSYPGIARIEVIPGYWTSYLVRQLAVIVAQRSFVGSAQQRLSSRCLQNNMQLVCVSLQVVERNAFARGLHMRFMVALAKLKRKKSLMLSQSDDRTAPLSNCPAGSRPA